MVFLVIDFGGNSIIYGILAATYPLFQLIGAPILGKWSDIMGRKKVLIISNAGTFIGWIVFLLAFFLPKENIYRFEIMMIGIFVVSLPLAVLFLARALDGVTAGNVSVANAYVSDISKDENRSKNFGKMAISSNLGFIVGPALAGLFGGTIYKEMLPVIITTLLSFVSLTLVGFVLKESRPKAMTQVPNKDNIMKVFSCEPKECYKIANPQKIKLRDIFQLNHIPFLLFLNFLIFLGFNVFYSSFPIHAASTLKWSVTEMGIFYSILSGIMVIVQGPILRKALQKFTEEHLVILGSMILSINFALLVSTEIILIYTAAILFAIGNGLMWPSFMSILSKFAGNIHQGIVQGFASSIGSLASIIGLVIGGVFYGLIGSLTFFISAGTIVAVFFTSFHLLNMRESNNKKFPR